jgi:hypothetical protein
MTLTEADIDEFLALCDENGDRLTREEAREAAARLLLVYERLAMPTPSELQAARLVKSSPRGSLSDEPAKNGATPSS